jgi:two-component system phosphate regulon sensor histidine kinase PhoR
MRPSLAYRITLPIVVWAILMATAGVIIARYLFERQLLRQHEGYLLSQAHILARQLEDLRQEGDTVRVRSVLVEYSRLIEAWVAIYDLNGGIKLEEWGESWTFPRLDRVRALAQTVSVSNEVRVNLFRSPFGQLLMATVPLHDDTLTTELLRVAIFVDEGGQTLKTITYSLVLLGMIAVVTALGIALLVSRWVTAPLNHLTESISHWPNNETSLEIAQHRKDEIGQLAQAFSVMAGELRSQIEALATERVQFDAVLEYMTDGVVIVDAEGKVRLMNPAAERLFEARPDGCIGKSLIEVVRHHQLVDLWQKSLANDRQYNLTLEMTPNRLFVQAIATPLGGTLKGNVLLVIQDLTRVRRLETVRRDFISNVSHELRTPLATLKALTETLQEGALEDPLMARRFLEQMDKEIDNMTQLVRELLELSRIESGKVPLNRQPISPSVLLENAASRMRLQAERVGLALEVLTDPNLPMVLADRERIEQVLINLLHNAIKFTPPGGRIELGAQRREGEVVFYVKDTGVGISPESLPRIFERFYKADQSRSGGGTGLGLSIARHTVEAHGGRIWAESEVNRGSTFFFSLPIANP